MFGGRLPVIKSGISPPPPAHPRGPSAGGHVSRAAGVSQLLARMDKLRAAERKQRDYFCPKAGSPIKGIFNCDAHLDTWSTTKQHRYADVLMADKFREHELAVQQSIRERRREKLASVLGAGDALDRPSLLSSDMQPSERALFHRPKGKHEDRAGKRSKSCEPLLTGTKGADLVRPKEGNDRLSFKSKKQNWTKEVDLKTGRTYFFDSLNGTSSWDAPPQFPLEHGRLRQLRQRRQEEEEANDEMLNLQVLVEESPVLMEQLRQAGFVDTNVNTVMGVEAPHTALRHPALSPRNLEDMAAVVPSAHGSDLHPDADDLQPHCASATLLQDSARRHHDDACRAVEARSESQNFAEVNTELCNDTRQIQTNADAGGSTGMDSGGSKESVAKKRARFLKLTGSELEGIPQALALRQLGAVLVVDTLKGKISRLCDEMTSTQAALLLQRNYRMRRSRLCIERKYLAEDLWKFFSTVACHYFNRSMALLLNTTTDQMLMQSALELQKDEEIAGEVHAALVHLQSHPRTKRGCREDFKRFCHAAGIRIVETRGSQLDALFETQPETAAIKPKKIKRSGSFNGGAMVRRTRSAGETPAVHRTHSSGEGKPR